MTKFCCRATTAGVIGGKTLPFLMFSYGLPLMDVGLTMFLYGDDYGKDPRGFIGWNNETKHIFFYLILPVVVVRARSEN